MKKIYFSLLAILFTCLISFGQELQGMQKKRHVILTVEKLAADRWFIKLNNALNRFDPEYLRTVYNDACTKEELFECENQLFRNLNAFPDNMVWQTQIAAFYHFSSVSELKKNIALIVTSLEKLSARYGLQKEFFLDGGAKPARKLYAKNKLYGYPTLIKRKPGIAWRNFVADYFSDFDYTYYIYKDEPEQNILINLRAASCLCGSKYVPDLLNTLRKLFYSAFTKSKPTISSFFNSTIDYYLRNQAKPFGFFDGLGAAAHI